MKLNEAIDVASRLKVFEGQQDERLERTIWKVAISPNIKDGLKQVINGCKMAVDFDIKFCSEVLVSNPGTSFRVTVLYAKNAAKLKIRPENIRNFLKERNIRLGGLTNVTNQLAGTHGQA